MPFRFLTAGESHGKGLLTIVEGVPAGLPLSEAYVARQLKRRQGGYGRGKRQQIETDFAEIVSGVRHGLTMGGPIGFRIENRDWQNANWVKRMAVAPIDEEIEKLTAMRPGHADLAGAIKYGLDDVRPVLERASARETTARVTVGSVARRFLEELGVTIHSQTIAIGEIEAATVEGTPDWEEIEASPVRCADPDATEKMVARIDAAREGLDTLGGIFEVRATNVPIGLGSFVHWDRKLDGRLAQAMMSMQAVKGVQVGEGFTTARRPGSEVQDVLLPREQWTDRPWVHATNKAGGLEGGVTNGEDVYVRVALKPISTLPRPLPTADLHTAESTPAFYERADVCVVPAAGVIGEAMMAIVLAEAALEKFGGDHISETLRNFHAYLKTIGPRGDLRP
jgi:chorismate synthase